MRANLPDPAFFIGKTVPQRPDLHIERLVSSGNDGHLFCAWSTDVQRHVACKIIPRANLQHGPDGSERWRAEVHKADRLQNAAIVKFEHILSWKDVEHAIDCVVLVAEFVDGPSLKDFVAKRPQDLSVSLVVQWLTTMFDLFHDMERQNVSHGDLHLGNVLVQDKSAYSLVPPRYVFRVTDFGVGEASSEPRFKDDYFQLADMLARLLSAIDEQSLDPRERFLFDALRNEFIARHLVERDPTIDRIARRPAELLARLQELDADFARGSAGSLRLVTPFDYLSCEQIGEDAGLLHALYSDRFLGIEGIKGQNNLVVTGPRGCGKTTVFRSLSLEQLMRVGEASPADVRYIATYYRCDDLYFSFPRYEIPPREDAIDIPIHFVTATLLANLLEVVETWGRSNFADVFSEVEARASQELWSALELTQPTTPDALTFKAIVNRLNKERRRAAERHRFVHSQSRALGPCFGPGVLPQVCGALVHQVPFLHGRPIYFFVDDYSSPKVTKALQQSLNRLFMQRASVCFFKLSTESPVSFERQDIDGKLYVESREFLLQNLGVEFLHADLDRKLTFVEDVFRRRFERSSADIAVKELEQLIGTNPDRNNNAMARSLADGQAMLHWGKETLCDLCSGDIHYLISLVSEMVRLAGGNAEIVRRRDEPRVERSYQNQAIRAGAGSFLKNLRSVPRCGDRLVAIVEAFGAVAHSHLRFVVSKNEEGAPPKQASRIEPYEALRLSGEAQELYNELLRYSVFIEDFRGKSRRGSVVPRLFLRRFLIPHFNLTFSRRDSIELENDDFEEFLVDPVAFERRFRAKSTEDAARITRREAEAKLQLDLKLPRGGA